MSAAIKVVDLTGGLEPAIWRYESVFPAFTSEAVTSVEEHGFEVRRVSLGTHMGTHTDALGHLVARGPMIDAMPLESYVAPATVLRAGPSEPLQPITADALAAAGPAPQGGDAALIWTGWASHWNQPDYASSHPFLTADAAQWLIDHGVRVVGMDTAGLMDPRIDLAPGQRDEAIVDLMFMEAGISYVAALVNVDAIREARPLFVAMPLKLVGLDGAPVRAVAIEGLALAI